MAKLTADLCWRVSCSSRDRGWWWWWPPAGGSRHWHSGWWSSPALTWTAGTPVLTSWWWKFPHSSRLRYLLQKWEQPVRTAAICTQQLFLFARGGNTSPLSYWSHTSHSTLHIQHVPSRSFLLSFSIRDLFPVSLLWSLVFHKIPSHLCTLHTALNSPHSWHSFQIFLTQRTSILKIHYNINIFLPVCTLTEKLSVNK